MDQKLHEQLQALKETLDAMHIDIASALTIQGLYREPEDFALQDTGTLIRLIKTEDFHFRFDFKEMDSVGRIKTRNTGRAVGGLVFDIKPYDHYIPEELSMKASYTIHLGKGAFGNYAGGLVTNPSLFDPVWHEMDFKTVASFPATLSPLIEETE